MVIKNLTYKRSILLIAIGLVLAMFIAGCTQTISEEDLSEDETLEDETVIDLNEDGLVVDGSEGEMADDERDTSEDDMVVCAMDVQECPDGSFVARNPGDNCNFYSCPEVED